MIRGHWRPMAIAGVVIAGLAGTVVALGQQGGNSGLPAGPGNPLAALQQQIDALTQQVENLGGGTAIQGAAESNLAVIRGTVAGNTGQTLAGAGFTVFTHPTSSLGFVTYSVQFDVPFSEYPSVAVSVHGFFPSQPVQTIAIDDGQGGITRSGFSVYIAQPSNQIGSNGSFGSQNWDFIAIGPR